MTREEAKVVISKLVERYAEHQKEYHLPVSKDVRIQLALDNAEEYIARLATMPDRRLEEKLEAIHLQSKIAIQKRMDESLELLEIWRSQ